MSYNSKCLRSQLGVLAVFVLVCFLPALTFADCPDEITVTPENPTTTDEIVVTYCTIYVLDQGHQVTGNTVDVWFEAASVDFIPPPSTNYREIISPLPEGSYAFQITYGDIDNQQTQTIQVVVGPQIIQQIPTLSSLGIVLLILLLSLVSMRNKVFQ